MESTNNHQPPHLNEIIAAGVQGDRRAQRWLFEQFRGKMFGVCLRYADDRHEAEDLLQEGFIKVFRDLHQFRGMGSFEGWVRRVIVNNALQYLKKKRNLLPTTDMEAVSWQIGEEDPEPIEGEDITDTLLRLMHKMPTGFRTVLNLYILEGYSHAQIAAELGISEGTSKSQLNRAKACLRGLLEKNLTH